MRVTTINSIELSSKCNKNCEYCPAKDQHKYRETGFMTIATFKKAMEFVTYFVNQATQKELNLFGIGESLLNPDCIEMFKIAHDNNPKVRPLHLNTNGQLVTEKMVKEFDKYLDQVDLTAHNARETITAYKLCRHHKFRLGLSIDYLTGYNDWAGQIDWFKSEKTYPCPWLRDGQAMIMSNGDISTCCFDAFGKGVIGNVHTNKPWELNIFPFELCNTCHQTYEKLIETV